MTSTITNTEYLHIDFETRSDEDIKEGLAIYSSHESAKILCMAWRDFEDGSIHLWTPKEEFPEKLRGYLERDDVLIAGYNIIFEWNLWNNVGVKLYGFPSLPIRKCHCVQYQARVSGLAGTLDFVSKALGNTEEKDEGGKALLKRLCIMPQRTRESHIWEEYEDCPEKFEALYEYCRQDVRTDYEVRTKLPVLSALQTELFYVDAEINARGFCIDLLFCEKAHNLAERFKTVVQQQISDATNGEVKGVDCLYQLSDYINKRTGKNEKVSFTKPELPGLLVKYADYGDIVKCINLRMFGAKKSVDKYKKLIEIAVPSGKDIVVRNAFFIHGAHTGRWAGRGVQPHNLPRGEELTKANEDYITELHSNPHSKLVVEDMQLISSAVRGVIIPRKGKKFVCLDYAQIEVRCLAFLSRHTELLQNFKDKVDIYKNMASKVFAVSVKDVTDSQRSVGKMLVLACGYGMGFNMFHIRHSSVSLENSKEYVERFRAENKPITDFWRACNDTLSNLVLDNRKASLDITLNYGDGRLRGTYTPDDNKYRVDYLGIDALAGAPMTYIGVKKTRDNELVCYKKNDVIKRYFPSKLYGGVLAENIVQKFAKDIMAYKMIELSHLGYSIVAHVHDEMLFEVDIDDNTSASEIQKVMETPIQGLEEMTLATSVWEGYRYKK